MRLSNLINLLNPAAPKGLVPSASDWVAQHRVKAAQFRQPQPTAWMKEVFSAEDNFNTLAHPLEPTPGEEFTSVRWTANAPACLYYMQGCRVLGDEGAVISPDNQVFADFTMPPADAWSQHACFKRRRIPPVKPLKGWYATIAWPESKFFFHWIVEALPRMAVLGNYARILDGIFVPSPLQKYHRESLHLLGFAEDKLIPLDASAHFQPEHLFIPHTFAMYNPPRWMHAWFKAAFLPEPLQPVATPRRLYVSRADAPVRRMANEREVLQLLSRFGFESVCLSQHSFGEQARLFNSADVIVGPHGAGFANIVFCREKTAIIEVMPPHWMAPCFMTLATSAGCRHHHLVAEDPVTSSSRDSQRDDIHAPLSALEQLLQSVLPS